ncbi:MAG: hypothetical protein PF574_09505 [Candidatus Delongbacteria bacterium]|jgi:hypothetical protein|nr:hypothetical protein [Candidatus Delongbacteria bacterium]
MYCNGTKHISELINSKKLTKKEAKQLAGLHVKYEMKKFKFRINVHNFSFMIK